jgi:hypothetical protein
MALDTTSTAILQPAARRLFRAITRSRTVFAGSSGDSSACRTATEERRRVGEQRDAADEAGASDHASPLISVNEKGQPFRWVKTADEILASITRFAAHRATAHGVH